MFPKFNIQQLFIISLFVVINTLNSQSNNLIMTNKSLDSIEIEKQINKILEELTLEEKVAMCHAQSKFSTKGVSRLGIPEIWMSDGPHGVRAEISWDDWSYAGWTNDSITAFPALTCLASTFNLELSSAYGFSVGEEARYRKKDVLLGPGVNIYRTPLNGRNFEYMGEDPFLASKMVVPYIQGVQKNGVAACVKHFVLNNQEHWRDKVNVEVSDRALHEIYLPAFKASVLEGKNWAIMGAYNKFRGKYTTHNPILYKILKTDWKFDGVVISDWSSAHSTEEAALYGLDIEMGTGTDGLGTTTKDFYSLYYLATPFLDGLKDGTFPISVVDEKVKRILRLMFRTNLNNNRSLGSVNTKEHQDVALQVAKEGIVLLKNESDFFPIKDHKNLTIAVIGENATRSMTAGGGSSELKPKFEISPLQGIKEKYNKATVLHAMGYQTGASEYAKIYPPTLDLDSLKREAIKVAKKADIVLFVGGLNKSHLQDCEGEDRQQFGLPFKQEELLDEIYKVNKNIGFLMVSGNAVEIPWLPKVKALLQTWYLGSMSGHAIADIVSGDETPSGKLPFTFPVKLEDNAAHFYGEESYPGINYNQYYKEDILVGYRWHETKNIKPLFSFGYGLSYTSFNISDIKINKNKFSVNDNILINCKIKNIGKVEGAEVIQVYVGKPNSKVKRALKELKGFDKIKLQSGEETISNIKIPVNSLAFYNETFSDWEVEKGEYIVYIGNASDNILKELKIVIVE
ncbi:MAG: glycosyl hydrolase [Flavobacteriaceae bacterium]|nr:glycosyl hydrolase [Flavobacteriaceae bacterium]